MWPLLVLRFRYDALADLHRRHTQRPEWMCSCEWLFLLVLTIGFFQLIYLLSTFAGSFMWIYTSRVARGSYSSSQRACSPSLKAQNAERSSLLLSLSVPLSFPRSLYLSLSLSFPHSLNLCLSPSFSLSLSISVSLPPLSPFLSLSSSFWVGLPFGA